MLISHYSALQIGSSYESIAPLYSLQPKEFNAIKIERVCFIFVVMYQRTVHANASSLSTYRTYDHNLIGVGSNPRRKLSFSEVRSRVNCRRATILPCSHINLWISTVFFCSFFLLFFLSSYNLLIGCIASHNTKQCRNHLLHQQH